jgi:FkbM family methyltransferase
MAQRAVPPALKDAIVRRMILSDRSSRRRFRAAHARGPAPPVAIRLRALGGAPIWIRPGSDDPWVARELVTYGDHWPPVAMDAPEVILDLGANIGVAMALYAHRFPSARIVGVEPDPANADLCRRNVAAWGDRCSVVEAAAWITDEPVTLAGESTAAFKLVSGTAGAKVPGLTIGTLLELHAGSATGDYVKMDIEGAEREVLSRSVDWADSIRCLSVEVHAPYTVDACRRDLRRLGFEVAVRPASRGPRVVGIRA